MEPPEFEPAEETVRFAPTPEAPTGESYDSVSPEDAEAEWLLRATESGPPPTAPERQFSEPMTLAEVEGGADEEGEEGVEGVPESFFESEEEEGMLEGEEQEGELESEDEEAKSNG